MRSPEDLRSERGFNGAALFRARRYVERDMVARVTRASTEPRSFERGDTTRSPPSRCGHLLQRSRALSSAEMQRGLGGGVPTGLASTEPRSFERGDNPIAHCLSKTSPRFNGAALFRARRSSPATTPATPPPTCFNGAALFRARRFERRHAVKLATLASTEPRSFERGDSPSKTTAQASMSGFNGAALFRARRSWGRNQERRESSSLQRSRALSSAEILAAVHLAPAGRPLQRSRALSSAEMSCADFPRFVP